MGPLTASHGAIDATYSADLFHDFAPGKSTFMVNYRVEDLAALLQALHRLHGQTRVCGGELKQRSEGYEGTKAWGARSLLRSKRLSQE